MSRASVRARIPRDFPVRPVRKPSSAMAPVTCGTCDLTWDDAVATEWTPAPSARCPFEYFHDDPADMLIGDRLAHHDREISRLRSQEAPS